MSLDKCLPDLERKGALDVGRSKEARELYEELRLFYSRSHGPEAAAALASQKTIERLEGALAHKKANAVREITKRKAMLNKIRTFDGGDPGGTGPLDPRGAMAIFGFDGRAGHGDTIEARWKAIKGRAHAMIDEILYRHHQSLIGNVRDKAGLNDLVDEAITPGSTKNANARELAEAFGGAAEYLRARRNEAGAAIGKIENWFPQSHSAREIRAAGYSAWRDFATTDANPTGKPLFDREKMIDRRTGEPFTDQAFEPFLRDVWETLRTDGWSKITEGAAGGKMLANQGADHRVLHFVDGPAWRAYNDRFGGANAFDAMMGHIEGMSRDIAMMEILGPNPAAAMRWLRDVLVKSAQLEDTPGSKAIATAEKYGPRIQSLYDELTGELRRPESERLALTFSTIRSLQTSAKLGSAILSALPTDPAFGAITRAFNGIPPYKMLGSYARQLNPASAEARKFAVRAGLIAEEWSSMTAASHRFLQEEMTGEVARRLSSGVLRASGLSWFTQAGRWAFGMDLLGHVTDQVSLGFDKLNPAFKSALNRHGITPADWDVIRHSPIEEHKGVGWILPKNVDDQSVGGAADKLLQMIHNEVDFAVPMPDLRTRAFMNRHVRRGTLPGELIKSAMLFKGFGIGVILTHGSRIVQQAPATLLGYAAAAFILTTLGGAAALEMKEIDKGKDRRPIGNSAADRAKFLGAAATQGGGFGIYGDFFYQGTNRFGGGISGTLAGPQAQSGQNLFNLGVSSTNRFLLGDKKARPGRDLVTVIKQETPGSSLWFARLAFEREVADQLQQSIDPGFKASARSVKRKAKQQGQGFWWEPGETSPQRAPQ
jgi:hypothetical protein